MKKLFFTAILSLFILVGFSQQTDNIFGITITSGAPSDYLIPADADITLVDISGTATLSDNWNITTATSPSYSGSLWLLYRGNVTRGSYHITVFDVKIPNHMYNDTILFKASYINSAWKTVLVPNFGNVGSVGPDDLDGTAYDGTSITVNASDELEVKDEGITLAKMADLADTKILIGSGSDRPVAYTLTGDIDITNAGVTNIQTDAIVTGNITNEAITKDKLEDLTRGYLWTGGASDRPVELDVKTSGKMLIGDGTDLVSVTMVGDVGLAADGTTTIQTDAITTTNITDANVTLAKLEALTATYVVVGNSSNRPTAVVFSGDADLSSTGVLTIKAGAVEASQISDDLSPDNFTSTLSTGVVDGVMCCYVEENLKSFMDGTRRSVFEMGQDYTIVDVTVLIVTASGGASTFNVGYYKTPVQYHDTYFLSAGDANVSGHYWTGDITYNTTKTTRWTNTLMPAASAYVTITSSTDLTASAVVATMKIQYLPTH